MDDSESVDSSIAVDDLFEDFESLSFRNVPPSFDHLAEVASVAKLSDYAGVAFGREDLVDFDDVLEIAKQTQNLDFVVEKSFVHVSFHVLHVDEF